MTSALAGISIPDFFLGIVLLLIFSFALQGMLPSSGWVYLPGTCPSLVCQESVWGNLQHAIMPALALGVGRAAILTRLLRASMLEIIRLEYVTTARAKGLAEKTVILKHALKNALIPTVTIMGLQVGFLIGGAIVIETLFALPGLGTYGINAIIARDYQQVQGFILLVAICFVVMNFVVDLTYAFSIRVSVMPHNLSAREGAWRSRQPQTSTAASQLPRHWGGQAGNASGLRALYAQRCIGCGAVRQPCLAWACCWCSCWCLPMSWRLQRSLIDPTATFQPPSRQHSSALTSLVVIC